MLLANQSDPRVTILHLKEIVKEKDINRVIDTKGRDRNKLFDIVDTCNTLVNNNGVGREVRVKEPMLAIDKPVPSPIGTLSKAVYDS